MTIAEQCRVDPQLAVDMLNAIYGLRRLVSDCVFDKMPRPADATEIYNRTTDVLDKIEAGAKPLPAYPRAVVSDPDKPLKLTCGIDRGDGGTGAEVTQEKEPS